MAETVYKKGELLFEESITASNDGDFNTAYCQTEMFLNQDVLIIEFDNIEYTCEAFKIEGWPNCYGGMSLQGPDFSSFPFAINNTTNAGNPTSTIWLGTKNPGTYSLKVYAVTPDSDSSSEPLTIRSYITKNLPSLNWNILPQIFEENNVELTEEIEAYLRNTPGNTNWSVFEGMSSGGDGDVLPKKLIVTGSDRSYSFTAESDFQSFEELQSFMDEHKIEPSSYYQIPAGKITLITITNGIETICSYETPYSYNGTTWIWSAGNYMEWRLDSINQTFGIYNYDD